MGGARAGFLFWAGCELSSGGLALAVVESIRGNTDKLGDEDDGGAWVGCSEQPMHED